MPVFPADTYLIYIQVNLTHIFHFGKRAGRNILHILYSCSERYKKFADMIKFSEVENDVLSKGEPVFLTKNGYGSMALLSLEQYEELTNYVELALDEADRAADLSDTRYSAGEVFGRVRRRIHKRKAL